MKRADESPVSTIWVEDDGLWKQMDLMFDAPATLTLIRTYHVKNNCKNLTSANYSEDLLTPHLGKSLMFLIRSDEGHVFGA